MTRNSIRELVRAIRPCYRHAKCAEKTHILDKFVAITGYHRKYAIRLLKHGRKQQRGEKRGWSKVYQDEVVSALIMVWAVCDRICSRRLHPFLPEIVAVLERERELVLSEETKRLLLHISRAGMDRCLHRSAIHGGEAEAPPSPAPSRLCGDGPGGSLWRFESWRIPPYSQRRGHSDPLVGIPDPGQSQPTPDDGGH